MSDKKITEKELEKLRKEVLNNKTKTETKEAKVVFDGRQYSIRFPKRFIEEAKVDVEKDRFLIKLKVPEWPKKPTIEVELIRENDREE